MVYGKDKSKAWFSLVPKKPQGDNVYDKEKKSNKIYYNLI